MVNKVSVILGGSGGGGRPDMAQSGGSDPKNSLQAINKLKEYIKNKIQRNILLENLNDEIVTFKETAIMQIAN